MVRRPRVRRQGAVALVAAVTLAATLAATLAVFAAPAQSATPRADEDTELYLVTLTGPGTSRSGDLLPSGVRSVWMRSAQDQVLMSVDAEPPLYRWTTALSGFAVRLTDDQADRVAADPRVALVEPNRMLQLAGAPSARAAPPTTAGSRRGGAGTVIGFVDSGLSPEGPVFAGGPNLGPTPTRFEGECRIAVDWPSSACTPKVVGAQWFVEGFGVDRLRDASSLSARDDDGHGTAVASVAAGNAGLAARVRGQQLGTFSGVAPQARVSTYKACWTAPDPDDDGCATADVVSAIDRATADGVDVLNVSVAGTTVPDPADDTVQRALLGAAEADIVVVAAAGNGPGEVAYSAPWITTVGAVSGDERRGSVVRKGARSLGGVMVSDKRIGPARLVRGVDVAAAESDARDARLCVPGSLDAAVVADRIVLCDRGSVGRTDKSLAVRQADGVGMVLANQVRGSLDPDLHAVPTVHVDADERRGLERWLRRHPRGRVTLRPEGIVAPITTKPTDWSRVGHLRTGIVTPEVLAVGSGVLAAGRPDSTGARWQLVSGTSVAAAQVSGAAAALRGDRSWSASAVRSALAATASAVPGSRNGAGAVSLEDARAAGVGVEVETTSYRAWVDGRRAELGTAALVLDRDRRTVTRTVTNLTRRTHTFTAQVVGLPTLQVTPSSLRLAPGETAEVTLRIVGRLRGGDTGIVRWSHGSVAAGQWPVAVQR